MEVPLRTPLTAATQLVLAQDLLLEGSVRVGPVTLTYEALLPRLRGQARRLWPVLLAEIRRALTGLVYERVVAGGGGVHLFAELLRETFGATIVLLEDRYAQAEGYRAALEHADRLAGVTT